MLQTLFQQSFYAPKLGTIQDYPSLFPPENSFNKSPQKRMTFRTLFFDNQLHHEKIMCLPAISFSHDIQGKSCLRIEGMILPHRVLLRARIPL